MRVRCRRESERARRFPVHMGPPDRPETVCKSRYQESAMRALSIPLPSRLLLGAEPEPSLLGLGLPPPRQPLSNPLRAPRRHLPNPANAVRVFGPLRLHHAQHSDLDRGFSRLDHRLETLWPWRGKGSLATGRLACASLNEVALGLRALRRPAGQDELSPLDIRQVRRAGAEGI